MEWKKPTEATSLVGSTSEEPTGAYARRRIYISYLAPAFASFLYGYDIGATSGAVASCGLFAATLGGHMSTLMTSVITSASVLGALIASMIAFYVGDPLGRRRQLMLGSVCYLTGTIGTQAAALEVVQGHAHFWVVFAFRLVYGLGIGFSMHSAPLYIAEIAPADVRGFLIALKEGFIALGIAAGFLLIAVLDASSIPPQHHWRITWAVPGVVALGVLGLLACYAPPSPRWLMRMKRPGEARAALSFLRPAASADTLSEEVGLMHAASGADDALPAPDASSGCGPCRASERVEWTTLLRARRPLIAGLGLIFLQQLTGQPTVLYYANAIFRHAGLSSDAAALSGVIIGASKFVATLACVPLVDRAGRRPLLLVGITTMLIALVLLAAVFGATGGALSEGGPAGTAVLVGFFMYVTGYQIGFGPISWVLIAEVFPLRSRARALGMAVVANFALNLLNTITNGPLVDTVGQAALFGFYGGMCVIALGFVHLCVPETKGKTLEEIEEMMKHASVPSMEDMT